MSVLNSRSVSLSSITQLDGLKPKKFSPSNPMAVTSSEWHYQFPTVKNPEVSAAQIKKIFKKKPASTAQSNQQFSHRTLPSMNISPVGSGIILHKDTELSSENDLSQQHHELKAPLYLVSHASLPTDYVLKPRSTRTHTFSTTNFPKDTIKNCYANETSKKSSFHNIMKVLEHTQKLKELINDGFCEPTIKKARLCHETLMLLSSYVLMKFPFIVKVKKAVDEIYTSIFCISERIIAKIDKVAPQMLRKNEILPTSYFEIVKNLIKVIENNEREATEKLQEKENELEEVKKTSKIIQENQQKVIEEKEQFLTELKKKYDQLVEEFNTSTSKMRQEKDNVYRELLNVKLNLEDVESSSDVPSAEEFIEHIKVLATQKLNLQEQLAQTSTDLENLKISYLDLINSYKKSVVKLKFAKEQTSKMEEQIKNLGIENAKLSVRVAAGFDYLTPRPSLNPILNYFGVTPGPYEGTKEKVELITKAIMKSIHDSPVDQ